ncbi:hypothetical protein ANO11243_093740 [Dothideomycetidae sp. 11243]|nr:hypothetical protein ANO11243_093740 [fungal sp. No.11243]
MKVTSICTAIIASALTVSATQPCSKYEPQITQVRKHIGDELYFCNYWMATNRAASPLPAVKPDALAPACRCILKAQDWPIPAVGSGDDSATTTVPDISSVTCKKKYVAGIKKQFHYPVAFCHYMQRLNKARRPIPGMSVSQVMQGCKCLLPEAVTTTATTTTTKKKKKHPKSATPSASDTAATEASATDGAAETATGASDVATTADATTSSTPSTTPGSTTRPKPSCATSIPSDYFTADALNVTLSTSTGNGTSFYPAGGNSMTSLTMPWVQYDVAFTSCLEAAKNVSGGYETVITMNLDDGDYTWGCTVAQAYSLGAYAGAAENITCSYMFMVESGPNPEG